MVAIVGLVDNGGKGRRRETDEVVDSGSINYIIIRTINLILSFQGK